MDLKTIIRGINGIIPGGISIKDFAKVAKTDQFMAKKILSEFMQGDIEGKEEKIINFKPSDRLRYAVFALKKGATLEEVSTLLNWKDFEGLVAEILEVKDFFTTKNLIMKKPRMEIDVIGQKLGITILIDCKHWKKSTASALSNAVKKQVERTKKYVSHDPRIVAIPAIVTLFQDRMEFIDNVPIVPIQQFSSFVDEFYGNLDELKLIKS